MAELKLAVDGVCEACVLRPLLPSRLSSDPVLISDGVVGSADTTKDLAGTMRSVLTMGRVDCVGIASTGGFPTGFI